MHLEHMGQVWVRRYTSVLAFATLLLVVAGGLVTSNDAALSISDWPLASGRWIPALDGGAGYEFAHRAFGLVVILLTAFLALRLRTMLAWSALAVILAQAAMGGVLVRAFDPASAAVVHAMLAQLFFGLTVLLWLAARGTIPARDRLAAPVAVAAAAALFGQTILGAAVRHGLVSPVAHVGGAVVATVLAMWAALPVLMHHIGRLELRRPAMLLLSITFSEAFLGIAAWMSRIANFNTPQQTPMMVLFTVAHVAAGSLAFGSSLALAAAPALPREGMAAA